MTTFRFTITAETNQNITANDVHSALDEIITDGQSLARQVADDAEATDRSRLEADYAQSLDISIEPGLSDKQRATVAAALIQLASTFDTMQDLDPVTKALLTKHNPHVTVAELRQLASTFTRGLP